MTARGREHGTRSCYQVGCRRPECVAANARYLRQQRRRHGVRGDVVSTDELWNELADVIETRNAREWRTRAACLGAPLEVFFLERGESSAEAKRICASCPVVEQCADAGAGQHGIWGGAAPKGRRKRKAEAAEQAERAS